ncbi:STAS domain-containing protein [Herbaspirillum sp. SJZ099]|uniref:STAS domain-containing protein n=1 Tax=Herbaspirillum sp. SJZ099 TaxID=2572916 RepID=UPI00119F3646|nr:STAS domain-containing protein [Herbaspirillum sp. SJZ099]TWC68269.1 anti-anti-sigma factor [Herbaspirillum sp. SJZ099]
MELKHTEHNGNLLLSLNGGLTIFQAAERKPELLHALAQASRTLSLDLSRVDEIDTAGIQLLLLLKREAARNGLQLEVAAYSPAVLAAFDLLQLHSLFDAETASLAEGAS